MLNRALMATYAPGSTFKVCSTIAGIESRTITMDETIKTLVKFSK